MLTPKEKTQFSKDIKSIKKRGKDLAKLKYVVTELLNERPLPPKYQDHVLHGKYTNDRACHIEPDWSLIYTVIGRDLILVRTGTHSDLYK
jgi:mRNA interferase YafQ